jgi:hypothetical protein
VAAPLVQVSANRSLEGGLATVKWDDEGVAPEDFVLVKDGVLADYQTTREAATWLKAGYTRLNRPIRSHGCAGGESALGVTQLVRPNLRLAPATGSVNTAELIARMGNGVVAEGLMAGGVLPVIKHIPGHGRAMADSHFDLPVVRATQEELEASDFVPFRRLAKLPAAMTAHVVFTAYDADAPASISRRVTEDVIRGSIGFDGLLMSDDLAMKALAGSVAARAAAVFAAGSDVVLACNGGLQETESVAAVAPPLAGRALARFERARAVFRQQQPFEVAEAEACLAEVLHLTA